MDREETQEREMKTLERESRVVGLRKGKEQGDRDPGGDVADGRVLWPCLSNSWCSKHGLQLSKAMGLFSGSCLHLFL